MDAAPSLGGRVDKNSVHHGVSPALQLPSPSCISSHLLALTLAICMLRTPWWHSTTVSVLASRSEARVVRHSSNLDKG